MKPHRRWGVSVLDLSTGADHLCWDFARSQCAKLHYYAVEWSVIT